MRKLITIIVGLVVILFIGTATVHAEAEIYTNLVTDETTIEEDFELLNMNIDDYYAPLHAPEKWYVVGMSEAYVNNDKEEIQTYFYIYNPVNLSLYEGTYTEDDDDEPRPDKIEYFILTYTLSSNVEESVEATPLSINYTHHIYKVKGFTYEYRRTADISILEIQNVMTSRIRSKTNDSKFYSSVTHSKMNVFSVELKFNSTLIIDEYEAVSVVIPEESKNTSFIELITDMFSTDNLIPKGSILSLVFYNFNFPDHIKPDSIEYARFEYRTKIESWSERNGKLYGEKQTFTKRGIHEYVPGTHSFQAGNTSRELSFETFVLGNRITKGEFEYINFSSEDQLKFNYDCSILLDSTYAKYSLSVLPDYSMFGLNEQSSIDQIELLELSYMQSDVRYDCQVVSKPVDPTPVVPVEPEQPPKEEIPDNPEPVAPDQPPVDDTPSTTEPDTPVTPPAEETPGTPAKPKPVEEIKLNPFQEICFNLGTMIAGIIQIEATQQVCINIGEGVIIGCCIIVLVILLIIKKNIFG